MKTSSEKRQIIFVTKIHNSNHHVYLIVDGINSCLINYIYDEDRLANICPCCLTRQNSIDIMNVVIGSVDDGFIKEKITWANPSEGCWSYGDSVELFNSVLRQDYFIGGSTDKISLEVINLIREEDSKRR